MCMQTSAVRPCQKWHWGGDEIVHSPVIPAYRRASGSRKSGYPIDIRGFLSIENNAVVRQWASEWVQRLGTADQLRFYRHDRGNFDFRAHQVCASMQRLRYRTTSRGMDQWRFPEETIALGGGDCEDLAFLLAALLAQVGISPDCIRVALGSVINHADAEGPKTWDHAWVVYQSENGAWTILEPMAHVHHLRDRSPAKLAQPGGPGADIEYVPHFVFNSHHLWRVRSPEIRAGGPFADYLTDRPDRFWSGFNPSFAAGVHADIYDQALRGMNPLDLLGVKIASLGVDIDAQHYDPRDHFDFAYIPEGWARVRARLATGDLTDFALAVHAIGDFYAHSLHGHFAQPVDGQLPLADPDKPLPAAVLRYDSLKAERRPGDTHDDAYFVRAWQGRLISGQWRRPYAGYPADLKGELGERLCLPDHDRLAVDRPTLDDHGGHALFPDPADYRRQFDLRRAAAIAHIREVYKQWKPRPRPPFSD